MALPPTIPTSFVPHPSGGATQRLRSDFVGAFPLVAYGLLALVVVLALGVFVYGRVLAAQKDSKDAQLAKAEAAIDPATVESFVRLRDRLTSGQTLLNAHPSYASFFSALETMLPSTVRFTSLHLSMDQTGVVKLDGAGVAKSFNALAATSAAFAKDGRIKNAIFSNISVNRDNSVLFSLTATLDSKLTAFSPTAPGFTASSTQL